MHTGSGEQLRVLLIDDNPDDRALVTRELNRDFAQPNIIQIGTQDALDRALDAGDFNVVITDYALRWSNGITVLQAIRARYPDVPVIMFTNSGSQEVAVEAMKSGLDDYVIKSPQHLVRLAQAVSSALQRARTRRDMQELQTHTRDALDALMAMAHILVESPTGDEAIAGAEAGELGTREVAQVTATRVAALARRVIGSSRAGIHAIDPATGAVQPLAVVGFTPEQEAHWFAVYREQQQTLEGRLGLDVAAQLQAGEVVALDAKEPPLSHLHTYDASTMLLAPMRIGERIVGILTLDHAGDMHTFSPDEIALSGALAQLTAMVIERERLLQEREQQRAQVIALAESNRRMDEFLGIAGHELRTPLTSIKANLQMLRKRAKVAFGGGAASAPLSAEQRLERLQVLPELLERTLQSAGRLERLVSDLLDVSRISSGQLPLHAERTDLRAIVRDAVREEQESNPGRDIRVWTPGGPVAVFADAGMLVAAVANYIGNAIKYSREEMPVEVTLRVESDVEEDAESRTPAAPGGLHAVVSVRDFGPGLSPEQQRRVWERFYRAEIPHQSGSGVGLGLGLYIAKSILERHGGFVGVTSAPGEGSTFFFGLPLHPAPDQAASAQDA